MVAFASVALLLIVTPGPDLLLVTRTTVRHGRRLGLATALGSCSGLLVHAAGAALGLSALLATSASAFTVVKLAGAAYLCALGVRALVQSWRGDGPRLDEGGDSGARSAVTAFRRGALTNVLNPKVAVFFVSFLPQFVETGGATRGAIAVQTLVLGAVFVGLSVLVLVAVTLVVTAVRRLLVRPLARRVLDGVSGVAFLGFGARLAAATR